MTTPVKVFNAARGEVLGGGAGGRVIEVRAREGDEVRRGDLLIRLETERLDNEIARQRRTLRAGEEELETLVRQAALTLRQFEATRAKAGRSWIRPGSRSGGRRSSRKRTSGWFRWSWRPQGMRRASSGSWWAGTRRRGPT